MILFFLKYAKINYKKVPMKKIVLIIIMMLSFVINVDADSINGITMDIFLDKYGTAHVTEKWDVNINKGTEGYKPYYNIGNARFSDFKVSDLTNEYQFINSWNVNGTFDSKAYKNGINYLNDELELCWGISKYGKNIYTLNYKIEGFVSETSDKQMIFWNLIPHELSLKPQNVSIVIWSDQYFSSEIPVWGYGNYGGTAYVYDGKIEMNSDGALDSSEYMTILVEFPLGMFETNNILDKTFDEYYEEAEIGTIHYQENNIKNIIATIITIVFTVMFPIILTFLIAKSLNNKHFKKNISKGKFPKDLIYFRDIPCNKDIYYAFFLSYNYNLMKNKNDFLGALILNWVKNGYVKVEKIEKKGIFKTGEESTLVMDLTKFDLERTKIDYLEADMFDYMYEASKDGILESKEFSRYCETHYNKILRWFDKVLNNQKDIALDANLIIKEKKISTKYFETNSIYEESTKLAGLKKFLKDFSSIDDKSAIHVHLWEYYLMFAQIFGIADKVAKEFKEMYPDVITDASYNNVIFIHTMSYNSINSATTARTKAQSYSAGGGGFSSGGGGGGSFGGGGGGGGFR